MTQVEMCLERAALTEQVAERMSIGEQRDMMLKVAAQWRRMAEEAQTKTNPQGTLSRNGTGAG